MSLSKVPEYTAFVKNHPDSIERCFTLLVEEKWIEGLK